MRRNLPVVSMCATLMICASVQAQQIENPTYTAWAKYKVGTSVTLSSNTSAMGQSMKGETKSTLTEVTPEKVVVEMVSSMDMGGTKMNQPAQKLEIKKMMDAGPTTAPSQGQVDPAVLAKATEESVTVPAGTFKAKAVESTRNTNGIDMKTKIWFSPDVPGGTVKMTATGTGAMTMEMTGEVTAIEKK